MAGPGDLVTVLSLEDFEFRTGLRNDAAAAKKFGDEVEGAGNRAQRAMQRFADTTAGAVAGAALGEFTKQLVAGESARNAGIDALSVGMSSIGGALTQAPAWQAKVAGFALTLGAQLVPALKDTGEAAKEFARGMAEAGDAVEKNIRDLKGSRSFERDLATLKRTGSVEDVTRAMESNAGRTQDIQDELELRKREFQRQIESARDVGGVDKVMRGAGMSWEQMWNAVLDPGKIGQDGFDAIKKNQQAIIDLEETLKRAGNRADALNGAMADAKGREEQERRNKAWQDWSELIQKDADEIERLREANLTPAERKAEQITALTQLKERNPQAAATIDKAIAALNKPTEGGPVAATLAGSSAAASNIFAAMRTKDTAQDETNKKLDDVVENGKDANTLLKEMRDRLTAMGINAEPL